MPHLTFPLTKKGLGFQNTHCDSINIVTPLSWHRALSRHNGESCVLSHFPKGYCVCNCAHHTQMRKWAVETKLMAEMCRTLARRRV